MCREGKRSPNVTRRNPILAVASIAALLLIAPFAHAIPALQLYSPDAVYNSATQTWLISENTFDLWVVGNVGAFGPIMDVDLAASYYGSSGSITMLPGLAEDPNYASKPGYDNITHHAEFAGASGHKYYSIGDFTSTSDVIQDYTGSATGTGQIKVFTFHITGYDAVHFDAFDHYASGTIGSANYQLHSVFAPFSHDATGGGGSNDLPEPGMLALFGSGLIGLAAAARRKK
jgi:PEP-CTERM motif-containing protein